eukprot:1732427-Rhodomonas_salina.4
MAQGVAAAHRVPVGCDTILYPLPARKLATPTKSGPWWLARTGSPSQPLRVAHTTKHKAQH